MLLLLALACGSPEPEDSDTDRVEDTEPAIELTYTQPDWQVEAEVDTWSLANLQIDESITDLPGVRHQVVMPRHTAALEPLVLMLPSTNGQPINNQQVLRIGAHAGYRGIGLAYPNQVSVDGRCASDAACYELVHRELIDGVDHSDLIDVSYPNSITGRLALLLAFMAERFPEDGWQAYLADDKPVWSRIIVMGIEQGAGHAAMLGTRESVARVVLFGGGCDVLPDGQTFAPWCGSDTDTPATRWFTLLHLQDDFDLQQQASERFGFDDFGLLANADTDAAPYTFTHRLFTNQRPANNDEAYQDSLADDDAMRLGEDGRPLLKDAYYYLLTGPFPE